MKIMNRLTALVALTAIIAGCGSGSVNDNVRIAAGETHEGGARSINGNVIIGRDAVLNGDINSVNGNVDIDEGATAGAVKTVNGGIRIGGGATIGGVDSVNGNVRMLPGSTADKMRLVNGSLDVSEDCRIAGDVLLINGTAEILGAVIEGNLETFAGKIIVTDGGEVTGNLVVKKPTGVFDGNKRPRVIIGPNAMVRGAIVAEREIVLYVHESATVASIEGAEAESFTGSVSDVN